MNTRADTRNIAALTGLRGVAALYVVAFHYGVASLKSLSITRIFFGHGYLAVDLFFVLSGYVMALNYGHLFEGGFFFEKYLLFLGRRFARVYPIYFVTTIAAFIAIAYFKLDSNVHFDLSRKGFLASKLLMNLSLMQAWIGKGSINLPAWSLSTEWAAYVIFPLLLIPCLFGSRTIAWLTAMICFLILVLLYVVENLYLHHATSWTLDISEGFYDLPVARCLSEFCIGILSFRFAYSNFGTRFLVYKSFPLVITFAVIGTLCVPRADLIYVFLLPWVVVGVSGGKPQFVNRFLSSALAMWFGRLSYSIYLIHVIVGYFIPVIMKILFGLTPQFGHALGVMVGFGLTIAIAQLSYTFVEVPSRVWLRHRFEGP